jgi:hypothetical protein
MIHQELIAMAVRKMCLGRIVNFQYENIICNTCTAEGNERIDKINWKLKGP